MTWRCKPAMTNPPRCLFCDSPATHFCDRVIALPYIGETEKLKGRPAYRITSMKAMLSIAHTCDAPMCERHRHIVGFICGKDGDTIDYCAGCAVGDHGIAPLLTPEAIEAVRQQIHTGYRRVRIGVVP